MIVIKSVIEYQKIRINLDKSLGFIPTMGNLHDGHKSLIEQSKSENKITIVSIFINPTQFNNKEDFETYPQTLNDDIILLEKLKVEYLFLPTKDEMYPNGYDMMIEDNSEYSKIMEGKYRAGHFNGMLTIVLKLLLIIRPDNAYFGEKDYQQLMLVKLLVKNYFLAINVIACETIRNEDHLPLSSRNNRLLTDQLKIAALFSELLISDLSDNEIKAHLENENFKVDYIETHFGRRFGAVYINNVRLIDNVVL